MISRDCIITVNGNTATIDSDIYLYKYDKNIQLVFSIINSKYMYDNDDSNNLIKSMQAAYAQVKFKKDDSADIEIEFDIQATREGAVLLTINEELTDEDTELGEYTIQIRLLDSNKNSVVTLPPVESCIHILAPLFEKMGADTNEVNKAVVNKAVARYAAPLSATTEDGTFNSKTWVDGDKITTAELNRMETGIKTNSTQYKDIAKQIENVGQPTQEQINTSVNSYLEKNPISFNQVWKGKKATFYGDSLTEVNSQYTKGYHKWIQEILGLTSYENYGVSGYKISDVYNKVNSTTATGDIIFVMCGVNDENFSTPLGTMGDTATSTIYGSYDKLCSLLKTKYPTKIILFITPHYQTRYPHNQGITSYEVSKAMKEVCEKYAINVYDNYAISGIYPQNDTNKNIFTKDGCHWNDLGHEIVGKNLANYVLNTYRYVYTGSASETTTYTITNNLSNSTSSNSNISITKGSSYNTTITANSGYNISSIKVTMGGVDITSSAVSENIITISSVTGDIVITVTTTATSTTTKYTITNTLSNCTNSNTEISVNENSSYMGNIITNLGYELDSVTVTMGGNNITKNVYSSNTCRKGIINIPSVTGNIIITITTKQFNSVNKIFTGLNQRFSNMYHCTALIKYNSDFKGKTLSRNLIMSNVSGLSSYTGITGGSGFGDNSGELTNGKYIKELKELQSKFSLNINENTPTLSCEDKTIPSDIDDASWEYFKIPFVISTSEPFSFNIEDIKIKIDGVEQQILDLGGFFSEETFTLK